MAEIDEDAIERCTEILVAIAEDRRLLAQLEPERRKLLLIAAGRVAKPDRREARQLAKALRKQDRTARRRADDQKLDRSGIRSLRKEAVFPTPPLLPPPEAERDQTIELEDPRACYVCKQPYREVHPFYDSMCRACGDLNWEKRNQSADLGGRTALVTGARIKIGHQAAIKLLRAGARVLVTTRFPKDAADRYSRESDYAEWCDRLRIFGIDLRHTPSVEVLCREILATEQRLDFIVNNACQTVRKPPGFYRHLIEAETGGDLPAVSSAAIGIHRSAELSQLALLPEDLQASAAIFPHGHLDADLQQVDLRAINSWRLRLAEVPTLELLEVHLVNAIAPFVISARLKPLLLRHPDRDRHIINVSAMEGQFHRAFKTDRHPHTNMAKASLNMLTRTSAADYARDGIHINSVDTGWITDEDPAAFAAKKAAEQGATFQPPLDLVDGAARILDPIFDGFRTGRHRFGLFFKDYRPIPW